MPDEISADGGAPRFSSDEEAWQEMYDRFTELKWVVSNTRLEAFEEARDRTYPEWFDEGIGLKVRAWNLIPYRRGVDPDLLELAVEAAKTVIPQLEESFERRELTAEFARLWGGFCQTAGLVNFVFGLEVDDLGPVRAGKAGGDARSVNPQRKWVAHCIERLLSKGLKRNEAERELASYIKQMVQRNDFPPGRQSMV